jgi:hypothetical protein
MLLVRSPHELDHKTIEFLILEEPPSEARGGEGFDPAFLAYETGKIMRECKAHYFETTALWNDHSPSADLPIIPGNTEAIECVVLRARDAGIKVRVETRWAKSTAPSPGT